MSLFTENIAVLRKRFPEVGKRIERARATKTVTMRSAEDATVVANRWLHGRRLQNRALLAVSGLGNGVHLRQLLAVLPTGAMVFAAEASPADLRAILERVDLRDVLADLRLLIATGEIDEPFFDAIKAVPLLEIEDVQAFLFAPSFNGAAEYYSTFFTEFARRIDFQRKLEGTRVVDAALWQANTFTNLATLADAPDLTVLRNAFRGLPMVLVSAGPSLDESLEFLRAVSGRAIVATVNSSYRAVRNAGIVPHLVLAADPREFTARGFDGVAVDGTWLFTTYIVNPAVTEKFRGHVFTWSGANELVTELRRRCGMTPGLLLVEQGTVSACAVDLAIVLGCDRVCLVGQDLAVRADGQSHAQDSFYSDMGSNRVETDTCRRLPGNTIPEVLVEDKLFIYLKTFEQLVVHRPQLKFLNTSRLGAKIRGIPYANFEEAMVWIGRKNSAHVSGVLEARHAASAGQRLDVAKLREAVGSTMAFARMVLAQALRLAGKVEPMSDDKLDAGSVDDPDVTEALAHFDSLKNLINSDPANLSVLEGGLFRMELHRFRVATFRVPPNLPEHARRLLLAREFSWAAAEGAWFLFNCASRFEHEMTAVALI